MRLAQKTRYALALLALTLAIVVSLSAALLFEFTRVTEDLRQTAADSMDDALLTQYERRAVDLSTTLSESLVNSIYLLDVDAVRTVVAGVADLPDVNAIAVTDMQGTLFQKGTIPRVTLDELDVAFADKRPAEDRKITTRFLSDSISVISPVDIGNTTIGYVMVNLSLMPITKHIADIRQEQGWRISAGLREGVQVSLAITVAFVLLSLILAVIVGNRLSRPIAALIHLARQVGRGNYHVPEDIESSGEIRDLVDSFVSMARDLRQTTVSKSYLDNILHSMLDGLLVVGPDQAIRTVNPACCRLLEHDEAELLGRPVTEFLEAPAADRTPGSTGRPREGTARVKGGGILPVLISSAELPEPTGMDPCSVWVFRDITRLKATQNALVTAMQDAERANHAKSQFLANMSHELRTPLNAIIGYSEILMEEAEESSTPAMAGDLRRVHSAGQHLLGLINDVLDLSKIEAGKFDLITETFELPALINSAIAAVQPLVDANRNQLNVDWPSTLEPMHSDPGRLRQILVNILSNAAKFTRNGQITLTVRRDTGLDGAWYKFTATDTGIGMNDEQIGRIFNEFLQADTSTTREYGGTGLGLAISRRMARMLGGEITVTSKPAEGSSFTVLLPATITDGGNKAAAPGSIAGCVRRTGGRDSGRVVLVIDDEIDSLEITARHLTQWGFRVVNATRAKEGLRLARELAPFAILLDASVGDMDNGSLRRSLKTSPATNTIPAIEWPISGDGENPDQPGDADVAADKDWKRLFRSLARLLPARPGQTVLIVDGDPASRTPLAGSFAEAGWTVLEAEHGRDALKQIRNTVPDFIVIDAPVAEIDTEIFLDTIRSTNRSTPVPVVIVTAEPLSEAERIELGGRADTVIDRGTTGWVEAVRVLSGSLGQRRASAEVIREG